MKKVDPDRPLKSAFYVKLRGVDKETAEKIYEIGREEYFRFVTDDPDFPQTKTLFSAVASAGTGSASIDTVQPAQRPPHLFYVLWGVKTGGKYQIRVPTGTNRLGTDVEKTVGYITNEESPYFAPDSAFGFWFIWNFFPRIDFKNNTPISITPQVYFTGWKYDIKEVTDHNQRNAIERERRFTVITIGGVEGSQ